MNISTKQWPQPLTLSFHTGLRPIELQRGVQVSKELCGRVITVHIPSAKHHAWQGQPWRRLWFDHKDLQIPLGLTHWPQQTFRQYVTHFFGPDARPYDLRRNFASQLLAHGYGRNSIALAIGHDGMVSLDYYLKAAKWPLAFLPLHIETGLTRCDQPIFFKRKSSSFRPSPISRGVRSRPFDNCS
jgi:hypothetical protein